MLAPVDCGRRSSRARDDEIRALFAEIRRVSGLFEELSDDDRHAALTAVVLVTAHLRSGGPRDLVHVAQRDQPTFQRGILALAWVMPGDPFEAVDVIGIWLGSDLGARDAARMFWLSFANRRGSLDPPNDVGPT
jgi:hypothetical protein